MEDGMKTLFYTSPFGDIRLSGTDCAVCLIELGVPRQKDDPNVLLKNAIRELDEYFHGSRQCFTFPIDMGKTTEFRRRIWNTLLTIPFGETISYGELAKRSGSPHGARAAGQAVHFNPLPIRVPCHRVIAADGGLGGFASGDYWKKSLLALENKRFS